MNRIQRLQRRLFSNSSLTSSAALNRRTVPRAVDNCDVLIVGAGPAGLAAAIRLKQLEREAGSSQSLRVVVLEKGSEVGAHIVSGCVLEPRALHDLLGPDPSQYEQIYNCGQPPLGVKAGQSHMLWLTEKSKYPIPHPPQMNNQGNFVISLSALTRWLGRVAEEYYGVEIYPGFAGAGVVFSDEGYQSPWVGWEGRWDKEVTRIGIPKSPSSSPLPPPRVPAVLGILTNDVGIPKHPSSTTTYEPGMFFRARTTLFAEGAHGSLTKTLITKYRLRNESDPQTYGFGLKEIWRLPDSHALYTPGSITHTLGFPLDLNTYGGGWVYHMDNNLLSIGLVVGADWENPYRSPYRDFQMMKHHPYIRRLLSPATRIAYAARVLTEGGLQSLPLLHFPGGALIGDAAGTVNVAKIKGVHTAMGMGILAAQGVWEGCQQQANENDPIDTSPYTTSFLSSWIHTELHETRNLRPSFSSSSVLSKRGLGVLGGVLYSGIDSLLLKGRTPWTFRHTRNEEERRVCLGLGGGSLGGERSLDSLRTDPSTTHTPIAYPPFDPPLSTDLLTSLMLTGTSHEEDQPEHLRVLGRPGDDALSSDTDFGGFGGGESVLDVRISEIHEEGTAETESETEDTETETTEDTEFLPRVTSPPSLRRTHTKINIGEYAGLLARACPAGVYEYVDVDVDDDNHHSPTGQEPPHSREGEVGEGGSGEGSSGEGSGSGEGNEVSEAKASDGESWNGKKLIINAQNCIHCKLCDIKVPSQDITWTVPEGGGGPKYTVT
ncbi:FAD NAD-P-binding domain-containing protein [Lentinula edodes]|uniref:electron-transferring-flavoprotein dehydrogenase n=1 Tax=Lentinula edodes TaxID=5353 RepID=A0A1Q3EME1_LENED|nr:FAD NAD-P-binding domain-containing protein [Lentinula edodes]